MNRLRVRVELNRRRAGVPMHELVSVVEETHKFFQLLAEDVDIDGGHGEWHASNFDPESLNFTAEFDGPVSAEQIAAFGSSFAGATSLRRDTIAQFTRIADFIGEDELVGFGLYQSDEENEPSDWRCLSRQDAMRFAGEIQLLARASGEGEADAPLPAVMNGAVGGRRLFKDRREREALAADPGKYIREVESSLSRRLALLEGKLEFLELSPQAADEKFQKMLAAMETHASEPPRQLMLSAPEPVPSTGPTLVPLPPPRTSRLGWGVGLAAAAAFIVVGVNARSLGLTGNAQPAVITLAPAIPAPPMLTASLSREPASPEPSESTSAPPARPTIPDRDAAPQMEHQFTLDVPAELRPQVGSDVLVRLIVAIDREGKVTAADVLSTKGEGAEALVPEALKVARWFHFQPARQGKKSIASKTMLSFTFNPD